MSTFGTVDNVSGPVEMHHEMHTGIPREQDTYTGKGIKRPSFEEGNNNKSQ